jgi:hypothetical protein
MPLVAARAARAADKQRAPQGDGVGGRREVEPDAAEKYILLVGKLVSGCCSSEVERVASTPRGPPDLAW